MEEYPYFPVFINLAGKKIVVVGAGNIAARRVQVLSGFTQNVTVVAPRVSPQLEILAKGGTIQLVRKRYERADICEADLVLAATDDEQVNEEIYEVCRELNIPVNVCSDRTKCDFYFPGIIQDEDIVIGVSAGGKNHGKAKQVTELIRSTVEDCYKKCQ